MYDPTKPNVYKQVRFSLYCKARQGRDTLKSTSRPGQATAIDAVAAGLSSDGMALVADSGAVASPLPLLTVPSMEGGAEGGAMALPSRLLTMTAAELHQLRVRHSAELGIQHAVELQREALETEHKVRKLEGADTKSKISKLLNKMRGAAVPAATRPDPTPVTHDTTAQANGTDTTTHADTLPCNKPHGEAPAGEPAMRAPLVFRPSSVAAGGFVLATGAIDQHKSKPTLQGKPSSTLLMRCRQHSSLISILAPPTALIPTNARPTEEQTKDETFRVERQMAPLLEEIRSICSSHGVVRSTRVHLLTLGEAEALVRRGDSGAVTGDESRTTPPPDRAVRERLRVFVRFDSVASAFTAAEELQRRAPDWCIAFFPTALYDAGTLCPYAGELLCDA